MSLRLENLGRLADKRQHEQMLRTKLKGLREQCFRLSNSYELLDKLDADALVVHARELASGMDEWRRLCAEIKALCADLGEDVPSFA